MKRIDSHDGFTLIELLLAMTIFSVILMIATVGFIGMNRTFTKALIRKELSEASQSLNEDLTRALRAMPQTATINSDVCTENCGNRYNKMTLGGVCYFWRSNDNAGGLVSDTQCDGDSPVNPFVIVESRYVLQLLTVTEVNNDLYRLKGVLRTNNEDAFVGLEEDPVVCLGSTVSTLAQTCSVENFEFVVSRREGGV